MNTEIITNEILPALVNGEKQTTIANKTGVSQPTISRLKDRLSAQIESFQLQLIDQAGQKTVDNITTTIGRANSVLHNPTISHANLKDYKDLLTIAHKKEVLVGQAMGILPSHTGSVVINNDNRTMLTPEMQQLFSGQVREQEAEEADFEVIDTEI